MTDIFSRLQFQNLMDAALAFLPKVVAAVLITVVLWLIYRAARSSLRLVLLKAGMHEYLVRLLVDDAFRVFWFAFALVMAADQLGFNVGAALTGLGIAGVALGFAAQDSLSNVIAGVLIFVDKPFEVGDWVRVADQYGRVMEITLRSTRIRTPMNTYVVLPNKQIIDSVLVNHTKHGKTRVDVPIGIAYKELVPGARDVLLEAVAKLNCVVSDPPPDVVVSGLGASSVDLKVRVWIDDPSDEQPVFYEVMEAAKLALDAAGIQIPYHHLQLFFENIDERVWEKVAGFMPSKS